MNEVQWDPADGEKAADTFAAMVKEMWDREEIKKALITYCRGLDRCDLDLALSAFHLDMDAAVAIEIRSMVEQSIIRHREHYLSSIHYLTNETIVISGDTASCESYLSGTLVFERDGKQWHSIGGGRWLDRLAYRHGAWRIAARRTLIREWSRLEPVEEELTPISLSVAKSLYSPAERDRRDPSYNFVT